EGDGRAEHRRVGRGHLDAPEHPRSERRRGERCGVGGERALVLRGTVDVVEHAAGQPSPGDPAQVGDRRRPSEAARGGVGLEPFEAHHRPDGAERVDHRATSLSRASTLSRASSPATLDRMRRSLVIAALTALLLASCGGDDSDGSEAAPGSSTSTTAATTTTGESEPEPNPADALCRDLPVEPYEVRKALLDAAGEEAAA